MSTLAQLSKAASAALSDAEASKARVAAHFLRVQLPELFRLARHADFDANSLDPHTDAITKCHREHA